MKKRQYLLIMIILALLILVPPPKVSMASTYEWITLPEMQDVPLSKTFTVTFNLPVTIEDIDGIVIYQGGKFLPAEIKVSGKQAFVTPVHAFSPNTHYDLRVFIDNKRYNMNFHTVKDTPLEGEVTYQGITDVKSQFANNQLIKNVHHYIADMGEGHPINLYVTDDYETRFGKGFAYEETVSMIQSIESYRQTKPYATPLGTLDIFFYTNESNTPLPKDYQAVIGSWSGNNGEGMPSEMLMNGSTMPYDFRTSYVHEFIHYFDFQSYISQYGRAFEKFWGPNYQFWLLEGGAEFGGYFFYKYPENTKNHLRKDFVQPNRESILNYAKAQGGNKRNLLYDVELNSFDDIYKASSNNYGITLSLFWYLVEQFGYEELYSYVRYIGETFEGKTTITQEEKDKATIKFFGKTEETILKDWLYYFDNFGGELVEYQEITTGTANQLFFGDNPLLPNDVQENVKIHSKSGVNFLINIQEWIKELDHTQSHSFREHMTKEFRLTSSGHETVMVNFTGAYYTGALTDGNLLHAYQFNISESEMLKLKKGIDYKIEPVNNDSKYKWTFPDEVTFKYQ